MRVIQIGVGGMGNRWLEAITRSDQFEHAAIVDVNDEAIATQVEKFELHDVPVFKSLKEALENVEADAVIDITPPQFHRENAEIAMDAGVPVLTEKPLAETFEDAQAIVRKSNETGVLHMVAQNYRYKEPIQALKNFLLSNEIGQVGDVTLNYYKALHFTGFRKSMSYPFTIDMSIHHFDMMRFLLDSNAEKISGHSWSPPWTAFDNPSSTQVYIEFVNGVKLSYTGSWSALGQETDWNGNWRINGDKGVVSMVDNVITMQRVMDELEYGYSYHDPEIILIPELKLTNQEYLLNDLYEALINGHKPGTTCQDNIYSLQMVFGAVEAFETGTMIQLGVTGHE